MKKNIKRIITLFCMAAVFAACKKDEIDLEKSIFDTQDVELTGFDKWLDDNFRLTYNIRFMYKFEDLESDVNYNLVPVKIEKAGQIAQYIKFLWLDAYAEAASLDFIRQYAPRQLFVVGSAAWKTDNKTAGGTDGGLKVTLYNINEFDPSDIDKLNEKYFKVLHRDFIRILNQKRMFDLTYGDWSATMYIGSSWTIYEDVDAATAGMVSPYSGMSVQEDFAEVVAYYVCYPDEWWTEWYELAGAEGTAILKKKIAFVKEYMKSIWNVDLDELRKVVRRRTHEAVALEIKPSF